MWTDSHRDERDDLCKNMMVYRKIIIIMFNICSMHQVVAKNSLRRLKTRSVAQLRHVPTKQPYNKYPIFKNNQMSHCTPSQKVTAYYKQITRKHNSFFDPYFQSTSNMTAQRADMLCEKLRHYNYPIICRDQNSAAKISIIIVKYINKLSTCTYVCLTRAAGPILVTRSCFPSAVQNPVDKLKKIKIKK